MRASAVLRFMSQWLAIGRDGVPSHRRLAYDAHAPLWLLFYERVFSGSRLLRFFCQP